MIIYILYIKAYLNDCITFYDDTVTEIFEFKWVKIRSLDADGNLDDRCWSNIGSITETSQQVFQEIRYQRVIHYVIHNESTFIELS